MLRCSSALVVVVAVLGSAAPSRADWHSFWYGVERDAHRNNMWPAPFADIDHDAALSPWGPMVAKGWQRQNLMGDHHFEKDTGELTQAGKLKLRYITTQTPLERRTVFVERALTAEATQARVEVLKAAVADNSVEGEQAPVVVSNMATQGWSAEQIDRIGSKYTESTPSPRLPASQTSSSGTSE